MAKVRTRLTSTLVVRNLALKVDAGVAQWRAHRFVSKSKDISSWLQGRDTVGIKMVPSHSHRSPRTLIPRTARRHRQALSLHMGPMLCRQRRWALRRRRRAVEKGSQVEARWQYPPEHSSKSRNRRWVWSASWEEEDCLVAGAVVRRLQQKF